MVTPRSTRRRITANIIFSSLSVRVAEGSSIISSLQSWFTALQISTACFCATDRVSTRRVSFRFMPSSASMAAAFRFIAPQSTSGPL